MATVKLKENMTTPIQALTNLLDTAEQMATFKLKANSLQLHQQRVLEEKAELDSKMDKLSAFIDTPIFANLPEAEQERLVRQLHHMGWYTSVLFERITAFYQ